MKPLPLLLTLLAVAVVVCLALQLRVLGAQRALLERLATAADAAPAPAAVQKEVAPPVAAPRSDSKTSDADTIVAAIRVLERRGEGDQFIFLVRSLRKLDADRYFTELTRIAAGPSSERAVNLFDNNGGALTDKRYIPVLDALAANLDMEGGNRSYQLMRLAAQMVSLDPDHFQPVIQAATRSYLDANRNGDSIDSSMIRVLIASGDPAAHLALLRALRGQNYGDQRDRTWTALSDLYAEVHPFPALAFDERNGNNEKAQAERAKVILPVEQWITENRRRLSWVAARKVMALSAADAPVAPVVPATPAPAAPPAATPAGF